MHEQLLIEAKFFKGLADHSRLIILDALLDGEKTVTEIVAVTGLSQPNASMHLACLLDCGLAKKYREGRFAKYQLSTDEVKNLISLSRKIIQHNAEELYACVNYK